MATASTTSFLGILSWQTTFSYISTFGVMLHLFSSSHHYQDEKIPRQKLFDRYFISGVGKSFCLRRFVRLINRKVSNYLYRLQNTLGLSLLITFLCCNIAIVVVICYFSVLLSLVSCSVQLSLSLRHSVYTRAHSI